MTTDIQVALILFLAAILYLVGSLCARIARLDKELRFTRARNHGLCVMDIIEIVHGAHDATLLRNLADKWDSPAEQGNLTILARERYSPGGPSMPALWLRAQADRLEPKDEKVGA